MLLYYVVFVIAFTLSNAQSSPFWLYTGGTLQNQYQDWSWAKVHNLHNTTRSHQGGGASISWDPQSYDAVYLHAGSTAPQFSGYAGLEFWVYFTGEITGDFTVQINQQSGGPSASLSSLIVSQISNGFYGGISADEPEGHYKAVPTNTWLNVFMSFSQYPVSPTDTLAQLWVQGPGQAQPTVFLDDIGLVVNGPPPAPVPPPNWDDGPIVGSATVSLDAIPSNGGTPISPLIYGVNFAPDAGLAKVKYTANRNGGNAASRFNWEKSIHNTAADWFFFNIAETVKNESVLPEGNSMDQFLDSSRKFSPNTKTLVTMNMIGYAPLDDRNNKAYSYSIQKYGPQTNNECQQAGNPSWCNKDAGNGISSSNNQKILGSDIWRTTSKIVDASYNIGLLNHLNSRGTPPDIVLLDNEPMLWSSTHFDVFPNGVTYDDLWNRTLITSTAIKNNFPKITIIGPAVWGWCAYFYSAADGCTCSTDCKNHGSVPFLEFYLQQVCKNNNNGKLLVDYLDIHYYPQANGVTSNDESPQTLAYRSHSGKSLYNSGYVDESWINQQIYLIPRMKDMIKRNCPAMKFSISEYSFGDDTIPSAALANAEALAIFGREGVDMACKWTSPAVGTRTENAFAFFTNYDGKGANLIDGATSINGTSSNIDLVTMFGIYSAPSKTLYVLLFNKSPGTGRVTVNGNINGIPASVQSAQRYSFGKASSDVVARDSVAISNGKFTLVLSIFEATFLKIQL